jgi:cell division protein FtsB
MKTSNTLYKLQVPRFQLTGSSIINVLGAVVIVSLLISLGQTVHRNYVLGQEINEIKADTQMLEEKRDELSYSIQYYKTDSYREREARSKLGLQLPGENVIIIPQPTATPDAAAAVPSEEAKRTNFQQWLDFLGGKKRD